MEQNKASSPFSFSLTGLQEVPAVLGRGDALGLLEHLGKDPVIPVARLLRHLRNGEGCGQQQLLGLLHANVGQIGQKVHADLALKQLADV